MKKIAIAVIALISVFATGAHAGVCNNASLKGAYSYEITGVFTSVTRDVWSSHDVGRMKFNGVGGVSMTGIWTVAGYSGGEVAVGTYRVETDCSVSGSINWGGGHTTSYVLYLDQMDGSLPSNRAYHGTLIAVEDPTMESSSGSITRMIGKFQ